LYIVGQSKHLLPGIRFDYKPQYNIVFYGLIQSGRTLQIELVHIQPGKPTQNAHVESFHGRLREECLAVSWFQNLFDARRKLALWRKEYNEERPHSSLGYQTPKEFAAASIYTAERGARDSNAIPCPSRSRLKPEREQQKVVVFLRERKQGQVHLPYDTGTDLVM
jgi:integrase-like protein